MKQKLFENIVDVIEEGQLKLGYREETVRLYYPLESLNRFFDAQMDAAQMRDALEAFAREHEAQLGAIAVSRKGRRFCLAVPPEGAAYVHEQTDRTGFLAQFIDLIAKHGTKIGDVIALFERHADAVRVDAVHNGEFDYLLQFEDGVPDTYIYCLTDEGCHLTYHRFTKEDFESFGF